MAAPLRRVTPTAPAAPTFERFTTGAARAAAVVVYVLPLALAVLLALAEGLQAAGWQALRDDPQTGPALRASLVTALASTACALALTLLLVTALHASRWWPRVVAALAPMLAVPHAAFAIGVAWLVAPAGWFARVLAPLAGWDAPPDWQTVNDPAGLALTGVLVLKELPFLLWNAAAMLARPEAAALLRREIAVARSLGYPSTSWWWRVGWRQWLPRLAWPVLAVLAYALTVVDLALLVGPGAPPTLAVLAWQGLADGNAGRNAQGAATAVLLTAVLAAIIGAGWLLHRLAQPAWSRAATGGRRPVAPATSSAIAPPRTARLLVAAVASVYIAAAVSLAVLSVAGPWRFPLPLPPETSVLAWATVGSAAEVMGTSLLLATMGSAAALVLVVGWLEATPPSWDRTVAPWVLAPLVLPQLLWLVGLYRGALVLRLDGTLAGLAWAHVIVVLPYVYTALAPAWRSFDPRYEWTARALGRGRWAFRWRVKWPLLAAPIASALAIGFAVAVAQYLVTQFIGAGRHATLTTEAVTLASGGQRNVAAAWALLQALLPLAAFALARWVGRAGAARGAATG